MANLAQLPCSACSEIIPEELYNSGLVHCPHCQRFIQAEVFPALIRPAVVHSGEERLEKEASCFFHDNKKAAISCGACGRFICSLCDIEFDGRHLCPSCLSSGHKKHKFKNMENRRVLYDNIALSLAILPNIFFFITFLTAPAVFYFVIRYWKAPSSIIPRTKIRFIFAACLAFLQIFGWSLLGYGLGKKMGWF
jgi:hypothetical protein